jgi:hypothetical protein
VWITLPRSWWAGSSIHEHAAVLPATLPRSYANGTAATFWHGFSVRSSGMPPLPSVRHGTRKAVAIAASPKVPGGTVSAAILQ